MNPVAIYLFSLKYLIWNLMSRIKREVCAGGGVGWGGGGTNQKVVKSVSMTSWFWYFYNYINFPTLEMSCLNYPFQLFQDIEILIDNNLMANDNV